MLNQPPNVRPKSNDWGDSLSKTDAFLLFMLACGTFEFAGVLELKVFFAAQHASQFCYGGCFIQWDNAGERLLIGNFFLYLKMAIG